MPYTPEQIEEAKADARLLWNIYNSTGGSIWFFDNARKKHDIGVMAKTILAALEDVQKERDDIESRRIIANMAANSLQEQRDAFAAYAAKLEKAGDGMRSYKPDSNPLQAETDIEELFDAWDAARQTKPNNSV